MQAPSVSVQRSSSAFDAPPLGVVASFVEVRP
jgi:hypothetical protein